MARRISPLLKLESRRRELGMTIDVVAKRSGISKATVERVLTGTYGGVSFDAVQAIAEAVGATVSVTDAVDTQEMLERQAEQRARQIVGMVQGNSALEGQGISESAYTSLVRQTVHRLLAGSKRNLWAS